MLFNRMKSVVLFFCSSLSTACEDEGTYIYELFIGKKYNFLFLKLIKLNTCTQSSYCKNKLQVISKNSTFICYVVILIIL